MFEIILLGFIFGTSAAFMVGPIFIALIYVASTQGFRASTGVILGSAIADTLFLGIAYLFTLGLLSVEPLVPYLKFAGSLYFLFVGATMLREAPKFVAGKKYGIQKTIALGIQGNLVNPSTWAFWAATGSALLVSAHQTAGQAGMVVFASVWFATAMLWEAGIAYICARAGRTLSLKALKIIHVCAGILFLAISCLIWI